MATIIPRWEWRTFGTRFGAADMPAGFLVFAERRPSFEIRGPLWPQDQALGFQL